MSNIVLSKFAQRQERLANFGWAIQPPSHLAGDVVRMATFEDEYISYSLSILKIKKLVCCMKNIDHRLWTVS